MKRISKWMLNCVAANCYEQEHKACHPSTSGTVRLPFFVVLWLTKNRFGWQKSPCVNWELHSCVVFPDWIIAAQPLNMIVAIMKNPIHILDNGTIYITLQFIENVKKHHQYGKLLTNINLTIHTKAKDDRKEKHK